MPLDLTGISNENEFYTHHYLSAILESDLKDLFAQWEAAKKESEIRPPYEQLRSLARDYFRLADRLSKTRDAKEKKQAEAGFMAALLDALGYVAHPVEGALDDGSVLPVTGEVTRQSGAPEMWIIHAFNPDGDERDPLEVSVSDVHYDECDNWEAQGKTIGDETFEAVISRQVFGRNEPPRWVILCNLDQVLLLDRSKWNRKRFLRFDLKEIFGRREPSTFKAMAALLHRQSVCPEDGLCLLDSLDENAHKHAFAVSEDLKYALRESIELLGNEAVRYLGETSKIKLYDRALADQLSVECLRYMYRLLFLFYIEARPELGYAPMKSDEYRKGYSLESLRDLEMVPLTTEESRNGTYIHESIALLFELIYNGFQPRGKALQQELAAEAAPDHHLFRLNPLNSHLFDPKRTRLLNPVRFRNSVLQKVIENMSLTRPGRRKDRRGRISYAQLGINQLGAVYEALLSYRGFFAETDLYEVKQAGSQHNELDTAYFVKAEDLDKYTEDEKVYNDDGTLRVFPKGAFIYRLAGRDREKSASYYTPETLTRCLVKYALKALLKGKTADDILGLTVCEPAMGSAAFLNEAVNQLADAYLALKQKELGQDIPHDAFEQEKQKVKMFLADNNVFGVDLNPVAVELAEVSLWLNTIHQGGFVPWFGMQLVCGNSLIGARRQVYDVGLLRKKKPDDPLWFDTAPRRTPLGKSRPAKSVYHFLLPDRGMANYTDKAVKAMADDEFKAMARWRKEFTKPFGKADVAQLQKLSDAVDRLWISHAKDEKTIRARTTDPLLVFGQEKPLAGSKTSATDWKDRVFDQEFHSRNVRHSSAYRRLKLAMDYWCALWFWPIEQADLLPTRGEFLLELSLILEGGVYASSTEAGEQMALFPDTRPKQMSLDMAARQGFVNVAELCDNIERLGLVRRLAKKYRFLHWELEFADIFAEKGGFDLVLGNPPWIKVEWKEGDVLGDAEPLFVLRKFSAGKVNTLRAETIARFDMEGAYLEAFEEADGTQNFLNALQNYRALAGMKANLYKCFLPQAWMIGKKDGVSGFLHPEGVYDDPKGGKFRATAYRRLNAHFQFQNELNLFADVDHHAKFSINIYSNAPFEPEFAHIANLYSPATVYSCFDHLGQGPVPGIKDDANKWNVQGHSKRIVTVTEQELELFAKLYDTSLTPALQARLPAIHSQELIEVLRKFAAYPKKLAQLLSEIYATQHWNETNSQRDGTIRRDTQHPESLEQWILSGPHFFVGNPFNKTPRQICTQNSHYDMLDLTELPDDYLPRTNYVPDCDADEYIRRTPKVSWDKETPVTGFYRFMNREMIGSSAERTFIPVVIPKGVGHVHTCLSTIFRHTSDLMNFFCLALSVPVDFRVKTTGMGHANTTLINQLPVLADEKFRSQLHVRSLSLVCLNNYYTDLWSDCWRDDFTRDQWTKTDARLPENHFKNLTQNWHRNCALRTDYTRRQALVEIDVLAAMALNLTLEELKTIYRVQFPVLRQYESDTWYDQNGRIVFTCNKGLVGVGFSRPEWNEIKDMTTGTVERTIEDDTLPGGPRERTITYQAPFDRCDREADYETAWTEFKKRM